MIRKEKSLSERCGEEEAGATAGVGRRRGNYTLSSNRFKTCDWFWHHCSRFHSFLEESKQSKREKTQLQDNRFQTLRREILKTPCSQPPSGHDSQASAARNMGLSWVNHSRIQFRVIHQPQSREVAQEHTEITEPTSQWKSKLHLHPRSPEQAFPPQLSMGVFACSSLRHTTPFQLEWFYECDPPVKSCCKFLTTVPMFNSPRFPSTQTQRKWLAGLLEQPEADG